MPSGPRPSGASDERGGLVKRALRRLTASNEQLDAEDLQENVEEAGASPCAQVKRLEGETVCVAGRLRNVVFNPRNSLPTLEAELYDGTGTVTLVWLGRRRITGIEPGRHIVVRGRVANQKGRQVIFNPHYELRATKG